MSDLRKPLDRRGFIKQAVQAGTGVGVGGALLGVTTLPTVSNGARALAETSAPRSHSNVASGPNRSLALDGEWSIATDPGNSGREQRWFVRTSSQASKTKVPSVIQEIFPAYHGVVWYWREFRVPIHPDKLGRFLLRFDAVDYMADVWINGVHVGGHEGSETPFVLDVTTAVMPNATNLAAVRVLNPGSERIDGIALKETPHRNKFFPFFSGASYDSGGIIGSVRLTMVPGVRVEDLFVQPDWKTGKIRVQSNLQNALGKTTPARLHLTVAPDATGAPIASVYHDIEVKPGENRVDAELQVDQPHLWDLQDPYLYRVTTRLQVEITGAHEYSVRCGFRDFRVVNGYFRLNGKRIFLRSTHTGNHCPIGQILPPDAAPDLLRKDMLYAKAAGFNTVRFIGVAYPYQLDLCDEIGLMIAEESYADWLLEDSPKMKERWDRSTREMILRDRNHPCVTIWQLLNETAEGPVFRHAYESLALVRSLDESRLVLLSSGRFDGDLSIGTVSNPGSSEWERMWGSESSGGGRIAMKYPSGVGSGDFHFYPIVPQTREADQFARTLGRDSKPIFLSEYGIGSLMDAIHEARMFEQAGARPDLEDFQLMRSMADGLIADWKRLGMEGVYAFPEDMLRDSQHRMARHRLLGFNLVRSNPQLCGYNVTGMLDHAMTGEGIWRFWRDWKPGAMDVMQDGWWPLRWCLFVGTTHAYVGRPFSVEAVLATEDVLRPGGYPARFRISGPHGNVWERSATVTIPEPPAGQDGPLAVPVFNDEVTLSGPAGSYEVVANLERGGAPLGRSWQFYLSDAASLPKADQTISAWGLDTKVQEWLSKHGVVCKPLEDRDPSQREVIVVGDLSATTSDLKSWKNLARHMARGSSVIFLSQAAFQREKDAVGWLPLAKKGRCYKFTDHLYHKECVAKGHPIFDGLQANAILDWYYYGQLIPHFLFDRQETPDEVVAAAFAVGYGVPDIAPSYASGVLLGTYKFGAGGFMLNTFPILEQVDRNPAADRMLLNLMNYAGISLGKPLDGLPNDFEERLRSIGYSQ
jgi:Glycosyl hydrolases family 2, sugar binding domain/Glycosyl hydrolases family 2/Glycosyl hydrolases family 2, TIM barrel domain